MGEAHDNKVVYLRLDDIIPNRFQPREIFDEPGLQELSSSIKEHGVIQPIVVREMGGKYELIAGERRTKASALAGLTTIPAIIKDMDDNESAKVSLLENLQRKNLSAIEEARTYKKIIELDNMTQEELARTMGKSQPMVANKLRLLMLPDEVQDALMKNQISERHARSLLTLKNKRDQLLFLERIKNERLTVRELDKELKKYKESHTDDDSDDGDSLKLEENNSEEINDIKNEFVEENNERSFMNNNRGNFGGMGLNDYQSGITGNMYNNYPNNFNNMPNMNNNGNMGYNYNNFDDNTVDNSNNSMNSYFNEMQESSNMNQNTTSSLGSMFDGYNNAPMDVQANNNNDSGLFVSHIREDNLPKTQNQFLPNFDDFNQNEGDESNDSSRMALNNFEQNNNYNNINSSMNSQNEFNNFGQSSLFNTQKPNDFGMTQNGFGNYNQPQKPEMNNYNNMNNFSQPMMEQSNNYFMNDLNNNMNPQPNAFSQGMNAGMNNFGNNQPMGYDSNPIPDFNGGMSQMFQPNQGAMFSQPLNIVDVPRENSFDMNNDEFSSNNMSTGMNNNYNGNGMPNPNLSNNQNNLNDMPNNLNDENYNDMMFSQPVPMGMEEEPTQEDEAIYHDESVAPVDDFANGSDMNGIPEIVPS